MDKREWIYEHLLVTGSVVDYTNAEAFADAMLEAAALADDEPVTEVGRDDLVGFWEQEIDEAPDVAEYEINISDWGGYQAAQGSYRSGEAVSVRKTARGQWISCVHGVGPTGLYGVSDDSEPCNTLDEAALDALDYITTGIENDIDVLLADPDEVDREAVAALEDRRAEIEQVVAAQIALFDTMTTSEVEAEYGLADGTAKKAAQREQVIARKAGDAWLISRGSAEQTWGGKRRQQAG